MRVVEMERLETGEPITLASVDPRTYQNDALSQPFIGSPSANQPFIHLN